ncbi:surface carbohydrate biosynthesis protein [Candidatus Magnetaquicoccus inordinatus]|uniref:surface carbohydrate biosynthesis protein n=1 Tax=Candidatus Magnetaquicoccus inordinatus TaxID=2496818 RepID=UPI00102D21F5|nr:surface carbohydrate biosynthesis protein [Candidatus Magnetaquicoccus inordinatus]
MSAHNVVILVDDRKRDLASAALIAHHLQQLGCNCFLEPLEAYKAVLLVHKPDMIIFNHLLASHLVAYSQRLHSMGILTAVLPNEALMYDRQVLNFNAGRFHKDAHIDYYFCWHGELKKALLESGFHHSGTSLEVVGIPRFDFYFTPWSNMFHNSSPSRTQKKRILLCTNFGLVALAERPKEEADKLFSAWAPRISTLTDYWGCIYSLQQRRDALPAYILALIQTGLYEVTLRPHPRENLTFYHNWLASLDPSLRQDIHLEAETHITQLILNSDLTISVEKCTTTMESWISRKPTISLIFDKHPMLYHEEFAQLNVSCYSPEELPGLVAQELAAPEQSAFAAARQAHLERWCAALDGQTCQRIASIIKQAVDNKAATRWSEMQFADYTRAAKMRLKTMLGLPYTFDLMLLIKSMLLPQRYATKMETVQKTITPKQIHAILKQIASVG